MWECKGEAVSEREHLLCYLEWQCPEVQSEVQQESRKKSGDLCARWHRGINFLTKLSPTIKPKSMPKSPKRDLKNNTFTRQHSHLFFFPYKGQADSSNPMMRKKIECLRIFICTLCGINFYLWLIFFFLLWDLSQYHTSFNSNRCMHVRAAKSCSAQRLQSITFMILFLLQTFSLSLSCHISL